MSDDSARGRVGRSYELPQERRYEAKPGARGAKAARWENCHTFTNSGGESVVSGEILRPGLPDASGKMTDKVSHAQTSGAATCSESEVFLASFAPRVSQGALAQEPGKAFDSPAGSSVQHSSTEPSNPARSAAQCRVAGSHETASNQISAVRKNRIGRKGPQPTPGVNSYVATNR